MNLFSFYYIYLITYHYFICLSLLLPLYNSNIEAWHIIVINNHHSNRNKHDNDNNELYTEGNNDDNDKTNTSANDSSRVVVMIRLIALALEDLIIFYMYFESIVFLSSFVFNLIYSYL